MRRRVLTRSRIRCLTLARDAALADSQVAVHEIVAILLGVRIVEAQLVTHLMHDRREQIDVAGRITGGIRVAARDRDYTSKAGVRRRVGIDEPALALSTTVNQYAIAGGFTEISV